MSLIIPNQQTKQKYLEVRKQDQKARELIAKLKKVSCMLIKLTRW